MSLTFALQALLARHEAFMLEAEDERLTMSACISKLETDKRELEAANAKTIQENRDLWDQLEDIHNTVANSDVHIESLTATLQSTRGELEKLTVLAGRATAFESQLSAMESEQAVLQQELATRERDQRTAVQRWKHAERTIGQLQEQVDRIEREALDEHQRHIEVVGRLERQRVVERELETAAGRLKGAAAATTLGKSYGGSSVVSHFVKDILQDNANLQIGIVELRDMLMRSNTEVENLREQMMLHQPLAQSHTRIDSDALLEDELAVVSGLEPAADLATELHVHHHYHAPSRVEKGSRDRLSTPLRRPRKKRNFVSSGIFTPPSGFQTPQTPIDALRIAPPSSASTILSQTLVSIPSATQTGQTQVWSAQSPITRSSVAASSVPSSPQSVYKSSPILDFMDTPLDSSRATSPESFGSESQLFPPKHMQRVSVISQRSLSTPTVVQPQISGNVKALNIPHPRQEESLTDIDTAYFDHATILEEPEDEAAPYACLASPRMSSNLDPPTPPLQPFPPTLRRSASHESILSTKDPCVPTLRTRHSQLLTRQPLKSRTSLSITSPRIEPVISSMSASANPSLQSRGQDSRDYNRSILSGLSSHSQEGSGDKGSRTLGRRVGSWVWGKWGVAPASSGDLRAKAARVGIGDVEEGLRASQRGKARAGGPAKRVVSTAEAEGIDERLLMESLEDG
jgi:hypothetical protein